MKKIFITLLGLVGLIIWFMPYKTYANTNHMIHEAENVEGFSEENRFHILNNPNPNEVSLSIETNISSDRLNIYHKPIGSPVEHRGMIHYFEDSYRTHIARSHSIAFTRFQDREITRPEFESSTSEFAVDAIEIDEIRNSDEVRLRYSNNVEYNRSDNDYFPEVVDVEIILSNFHAQSFSSQNAIEEEGLTYPFSGKAVIDVTHQLFSGINYTGIGHFDLEITFYEPGTNNEIHLIEDNNFLTINSLNGGEPGVREYVTYLNENTNAFWSENTNLMYTNNHTHDHTHSVFMGDSDEFDDWLRSDNFDLNSVKFQMNETNNRFLLGSEIGQKWFALSTEMMFDAAPPSPIKQVNTGNGFEYESEMLHAADPIVYSIRHRVPSGLTSHYYDSYEFRDTLDPVLEIEDVTIMNQASDDVSHLFNESIDGNSVSAVATNEALSRESFYGETYHFYIEARIRDPYDLESVTIDNQARIENEASIIIDGLDYSSNTVYSTLQKRLVTERHISEETNEELATSNQWLFDGQSYSYSLRYDFTYQDIYPYSPINDEEKNGVVDGQDVIVEFYYRRPNAEVGFEKIQIYTANAEEGLPINLDFNLNIINEIWQEDEVIIRVIEAETEEVLIEDQLTTSELDSGLEWVIPPDTLETNSYSNYIASLESLNTETTLINAEAASIDTNGYTSSEITLEAAARQDDEIEYEGVVMTERVIHEDMEEYYERLYLPLESLDESRSGYGVEINQVVNYRNELEEDVVDLSNEFEAVLDSEVVDGDFYFSNNGETTIDLDYTEEIEENSLKRNYVFPEVFVENNTGRILETRNSSSDLTGGNKIYIPIWIDQLGVYDYRFQNREPLGIHEVNVRIEDDLNIFAYMYAHMDSVTVDKDSILISPVDLTNPFLNGLPNGWTNQDVEWLQNN